LKLNLDVHNEFSEPNGNLSTSVKKLLIHSTASPLWRLIFWSQICAIPNHRKVMKQGLIDWFLESL